MPTLTPYQSEFVSELQSALVTFLVVGGRAMQAHGLQRDTCDLDILVSRLGDNPERLYPLIAKRMDIPSPKLSADTLRLPQKRVALPGLDNKEIDILTSLGALDFEIASTESIESSFGLATLKVLGLSELVYSKLISVCRNQAPNDKARDLADLQALLAQWHLRHNPLLNPPDVRGQAARAS